MPGVIDMASVPTWPQSSLSATGSEDIDRFRSTWRREGEERNRVTGDSIIVNGIRSGSDRCVDEQDINSSTMAGKNKVGHLNDSDHIVSVHNNPFFKTYGIRTQRPESRVDDPSVHEGSGTLRSANIKENDGVFEEDEPHVYKPGSGFVHKLMGKFSSLSTREDYSYRPKRTSSLENLLDGHHKHDVHNKEDVPRRVQEGLSSFSKSVENVNHMSKPLRPLRVPTYRSISESSDKKSKVKSPRESTDAPFLGRDDIIIIEKEHSDKQDQKISQALDSPGKFTGPQVISLKDDTNNFDELPKPNTVLSVRSMFEKPTPAPPLPVYTTATGPVVVSPTNNLKSPPFSSHKIVSKVSPSVSTESTQSNVSKTTTEAATGPSQKRKAPQPPVGVLLDQKSGLPTPRPRSRQSPVIAVAPFVNDANLVKQESEVIKSGNNGNVESGGIWPEESVSKVFDSSAVIKPPIAPVRSSKTKQYSASTIKETTQTTEKHTANSTTKSDTDFKMEKEKPSKADTKTNINGTSSNGGLSRSTAEPVYPQEPSSRIQTSVSYENSSKFDNIFPSEKSISDLDTHLDLHSQDQTPVECLPEGSGPMKGIPRFISDRLKKDGNQTGHHQASVVNNSSSQEENSIRSSTSQSEADPPVARKRKNNTPIEEPPEPRDNANLLNFRKNLKSVSESKKPVSQVFDTSQIVRTPVNHIPKLDLSSITDDQRNGFHPQEGYKPTDIKPCKIIFIGANVKTGRSLLDKKKLSKGKITFNDNNNQMFEYPTEEALLADYLVLHPDEPSEILILEDVGSSMTESSDDDAHPQTPRGGAREGGDDTLKSNTSITHSGGLSSYKTKYSMDFEFGASMNEPEPQAVVEQVVEEDLNSQAVPADEDTTWSTETTSDLLF
ncbi:uncharacterized protein LOC124142463 [Haliotis rufescens]|uniref:uncharacterized protein LOC124142463 n=1 Tax=Haliotis rufescens TaxID=6454 RepID=UPI001EB0656C|nr:uncharacterized protein LOC124142463 [Haliotis rufescens]